MGYGQFKSDEDDGHVKFNGALTRYPMGVPHQKSIYMVLLLVSPSNKHYEYISLFHIAYIHINLLRLVPVVLVRLNFVT